MKKILIVIVFLIIVFLFGTYLSCFGLSGDDVWLLSLFENIFKSADHGNIIQSQIFYTLNHQLPMFFNIHPQVFLSQINAYVYAIMLYLAFYLCCNSAFLFKKKDLTFPIIIFFSIVLFFSIALLIGESYSYWFKESCTYIRFTTAITFFFLFWNYFIKCYLLNNSTLKSNIILFFLGLLGANASEINSFVCFVSVFILFLFDIIMQRSLKSYKIFIYPLFGIFLGGIAILLNGFYPAIYGEYMLRFDILRIWGEYRQGYLTLFLSILAFMLISLFIIKKNYKSKMFKKIFFCSLSFYISCILFPIILGFIFHITICHGDIRLEIISFMFYFVLLMYGIIVRKIKNKKTYYILISIIMVLMLSLSPKLYKIINKDTRVVYNINIKERSYLAGIEEKFLKEYMDNKRVISLELDGSIDKRYREIYVYDYIPLIHKDVKKGTYKIEWQEN